MVSSYVLYPVSTSWKGKWKRSSLGESPPYHRDTDCEPAQERDRRIRQTGGPGMHVLGAMSLFGSGLARKAVPFFESLDRFGMIVALGAYLPIG